MNIAFVSDLDGTLIYSPARCNTQLMIRVEETRRYSTWMNYNLYVNMKESVQSIPIIPLTTRKENQYKRIQWPIEPAYALVENGTRLLLHGMEVEEWTKETHRLNEPYENTMMQTESQLRNDMDNDGILALENINNFFIYINTANAETVYEYVNKLCENTPINVYRTGSKLYVVSPVAEKGYALERLRKYLNLDLIAAAGDSSIDDSMLQAADKTIPCNYLKNNGDYTTYILTNEE